MEVSSAFGFSHVPSHGRETGRSLSYPSTEHLLPSLYALVQVYGSVYIGMGQAREHARAVDIPRSVDQTRRTGCNSLYNRGHCRTKGPRSVYIAVCGVRDPRGLHSSQCLLPLQPRVTEIMPRRVHAHEADVCGEYGMHIDLYALDKYIYVLICVCVCMCNMRKVHVHVEGARSRSSIGSPIPLAIPVTYYTLRKSRYSFQTQEDSSSSRPCRSLFLNLIREIKFSLVGVNLSFA